jgi:hypothetical protein
MTVDPRWGLWLSIFLAIVGALAGAGTQFTTLFGQTTANAVLALCVLLMTVGNAINAVLHAIPSGPPKSGEFPLGPPVQK